VKPELKILSFTHEAWQGRYQSYGMVLARRSTFDHGVKSLKMKLSLPNMQNWKTSCFGTSAMGRNRRTPDQNSIQM